ncbi:MAG: AAA family ATPase [Methanobacteriaceae archaeon]|nr:AAA family ATPase [Methanobacteriaceae archaeon]
MKLNNITPDPISSEKKKSNSFEESKRESKLVVLQSIGYPFLCNLMENPKIDIFDKELFELYAREQWEGYTVNEGLFLFDQKLLPDFAFKIVKAHPDNSRITKNTSILLMEVQESREIKRIESKIMMEDVIGQERAKTKCKIIMKYLQEPEIFGDWAPRNVLFHGAPGTGKTMLAKSLSNELKIPLFLVKATSLIGEHVGDGARQIHDLFEMASGSSPSVIFIDEIDAIGLDRRYQSLRGDVSEVVNALLTELDGINPNQGVVTIGATNNPPLLDQALRSRFEEEIEFLLPEEGERLAILELYSASIPIEVDVDLKKLASVTSGFSGRDIKERVLKVALHKALSDDEDVLVWKHIEYALKHHKKDKKDPKGMYA